MVYAILKYAGKSQWLQTFKTNKARQAYKQAVKDIAGVKVINIPKDVVVLLNMHNAFEHESITHYDEDKTIGTYWSQRFTK